MQTARAKAFERALEITTAFLAAIREAGPMGIPSGHLYATAMQAGITLDSYESIIRVLKEAGKVKETNDLLIAIQEVPEFCPTCGSNVTEADGKIVCEGHGRYCTWSQRL